MAITATTAVRDGLTNVKLEGMKIYRVYDASSRCIQQFEAPAPTPDGGICLRTDYVYSGTSNNVIFMKESSAIWSMAWDLL